MRREPRGGVHRDEAGGIITGWLGQLLVIMAIIGFVGFEVVTVGVTAVSLQDQAREVAQVAATAYVPRQDLQAARDAADAAGGAIGVTVLDVTVEGDDLTVRVTRVADTLVIHRIGFLDGVTRATASGRVNWRL